MVKGDLICVTQDSKHFCTVSLYSMGQHKIFLKKLYATPIYHGINTRLCEYDKF